MMQGKDIQIEDGGFTRIHNAILDTLAKAHLSPLEFRIVFFLIRKTYGFQKKSDVISISQFEEIGGSRQATIAALKNLMRLRVIIRESVGNSYRYGFNKYIETWLPEVFESRRPNQQKNFGGQVGGSQADGSQVDETSQVDSSQADGTSNSQVDETKNSQADGTHKRNKETIKERIPKNSSEFFGHREVFSTLAKICKIDIKLKRGQLNKAAKTLMDAGYVLDDLTQFEGWWYRNDWRGKRGSPPTVQQVIDNILLSKQIPKITPVDTAPKRIKYDAYGNAIEVD